MAAAKTGGEAYLGEAKALGEVPSMKGLQAAVTAANAITRARRRRSTAALH